MSATLVRLGFAGLLVAMCLLLPLSPRPMGPLGYIVVGASLSIAFEVAAPALLAMLKRLRDGVWPGEETLRGRVELTHAVTPRDRWLAAERLLHAHFGGELVAEDVSRLDALAAEGWRVSSTEPINALHLRREGEHRILVPSAWINGTRISNGEPGDE